MAIQRLSASRETSHRVCGSNTTSTQSLPSFSSLVRSISHNRQLPSPCTRDEPGHPRYLHQSPPISPADSTSSSLSLDATSCSEGASFLAWTRRLTPPNSPQFASVNRTSSTGYIKQDAVGTPFTMDGLNHWCDPQDPSCQSAMDPLMQRPSASTLSFLGDSGHGSPSQHGDASAKGAVNARTPDSSIQSPECRPDVQRNSETPVLPRFFCTKEVPGQGKLHFYIDGTRCKATVNGEPVKSEWGVTKTGKPRRRLAVACLACRRKKIKCSPKESTCARCDRMGLPCRYSQK